MKFGNTIYVQELQENKDNKQFLNTNFITLEKYFEKYEKIVLNERQLEMLINGVKININKKDGIYRIECKNTIIGTGEIKENKLKRDIVL